MSSHGLGHPSHRATKPLINTRFIWHGMNKDVAKWCRTCKGYQTAKVSRHSRPVLGKFTEPTERFDHVHIDIVGSLPYSEDFKYLLTCVDRFTRWPEAIPLVDIKSETVADAFFSVWIALLLRIEEPSSNPDCGTICVTSFALSEIVQRATTLSQMAWSTFSPSAKGRHHGTQITKPVDNYVASSFTRHPICHKITSGQIGRRDGLRHDTYTQT